MNTRSTLLLFPLMLAIISPSVGQFYVGGAGIVNAGYMYTPELSSSLDSNTGNATHFQKGFTLVGAEINYQNSRTVLVMSAYMGTQESRYLNNEFIEPFLWKAHGGFGWIISHKKSLQVYPVAGLGAIQSSLTYHARSEYAVRSVTTAPSMDLSIHFDYFLNNEKSTTEYLNAAMISVRAGYTYGFSQAHLRGLHCTISFGGVAFMKKKHI